MGEGDRCARTKLRKAVLGGAGVPLQAGGAFKALGKGVTLEIITLMAVCKTPNGGSV